MSQQAFAKPAVADIKAELNGLFPTPILTGLLPGAEEVNRELKRIILEKERTSASTQHSNLGGWQSTWNLPEWGGDAFDYMLDSAKRLADRATARRDGKAVKIDWNVTCWANVNRSGQGNEFHTHPGAFWSGSYYVEDGGIGADPSLGGEFEIQDPRGAAPIMYAPELSMGGPAGASMGAAETLSPRAGLLILFPSWLQHGVRPYKGDRERISIAFNLRL
ncbi:2OG-Fe(II) oxygenase family protein [Pelagibius sp. Alg239-R121]|uniref:2OG-Fe(II) oxygenase family protein n=1 Tax=Pelagibius sp. Alg239-R121 TaxID=2993448 RepID=UPI0024A64C28|nr:2OG-Fe(II) oxygenase family protein [Pelagibius sp. Alg239-R121]